ncbi:hypothetical protein FB451DRAFT_1460614 [Mycena latifolia]|nr:hypothetical protein FB451DRAFT_1460614 [Mycena latifolia]
MMLLPRHSTPFAVSPTPGTAQRLSLRQMSETISQKGLSRMLLAFREQRARYYTDFKLTNPLQQRSLQLLHASHLGLLRQAFLCVFTVVRVFSSGFPASPKSPEGAEAAVTATALDQVVEHLASPVSVVRAAATELLVSSMIEEVVDAYLNENEHLVSLVRYRNRLLGTQNNINEMARHHHWGEVGQRTIIALSQSLEPS